MEPITHLISQLPKPAQQQVQGFVEFLLNKYKKKKIPTSLLTLIIP